MLISLKAGGVALNLTVASRIFLMGKVLYTLHLHDVHLHLDTIYTQVIHVGRVFLKIFSGFFYLCYADPWWNPAAEMQAIDRTHRIGQHKPIYATRFIIENTIEERILRLQEKKKLVFDGTVGGDSSSMSKLTVDDMRFLFN